VLFIDALQRMVRIAQEGAPVLFNLPIRQLTPGAASKAKQEMADVRTETN